MTGLPFPRAEQIKNAAVTRSDRGQSGDERLGVTERTRDPHERTLRLQRTIQEAIGQQLKKEWEPPTELSTELATLLAKMDERENQR